MSARSTALVWAVVAEHGALVERLRTDPDAEYEVEAAMDRDGKPRQWYLSAYGRVLGAA